MGKKSKIILGIAVAAMVPAILTGCGHKHDYGTTLKHSDTQHYYECECGEKKDVENHEAGAVYAKNDTHHWKDCIDCGYDLVIEAHNFNQEVATSDYLKTAATATTKAVYYKSCVCGKAGTETFETDKTIATITNLVIAGKTYDGTAVTAPTFNKNSDGVAVIEYKVKNANDNTYTTTAPINAGEYTVRVSIPETITYAEVSATADFVISKAATEITNLAISGKTYDGTAVSAPTFNKSSDSAAVVEYKLKTADDNTYTTTVPINAGEYTVRVTVAEGANHTSASQTKDFTIAKKALTEVTVSKVYDATTAITNYSLVGNCTGLVGSDNIMLSATLNSKNVEEAESVTNIQLSGTNASNYSLAESEVTATVTKYIFKNLDATVEYNGSNVHYIDMSHVEDGVQIEVTFDGTSVICNATGARVLEGEVESTNYGIDVDPASDEKCTVEIVARKVNIVWTDPEDLTFDGTAKIPTAVIDSLAGGDTHTPEITLCEGHDNVTYGSAFQFEATVVNLNYEVVEGAVSPVYTIEDITEMTVGTELLVYQHVPYGAPSYLKINLVAGDYIFDFCPDDQSSILSVEIYKKGNLVDAIVETTLSSQNGEEVAFKITEDGEYLVKCNQVNDFEPQYDTIKVDVDEHETLDDYGFCDKGCGTYLGQDLSINSWETVTLQAGEKAFFRFGDDYDVKYNIRYYNSNDDGLSVKCYKLDNEGNFIEVPLSGTPTMFEGSFDEHYYLVFRYLALAGSADKEFTFQIEETINN